MASEADMEDTLRELAAASTTHRAQLIGLAAVVAHLPGVSRIDRALVDAAIEDQCRQLDQENRIFKAVLTYKGKPVRARDVSEDLGVRYVLEGSVRRAGQRRLGSSDPAWPTTWDPRIGTACAPIPTFIF